MIRRWDAAGAHRPRRWFTKTCVGTLLPRDIVDGQTCTTTTEPLPAASFPYNLTVSRCTPRNGHFGVRPQAMSSSQLVLKAARLERRSSRCPSSMNRSTTWSTQTDDPQQLKPLWSNIPHRNMAGTKLLPITVPHTTADRVR